MLISCKFSIIGLHLLLLTHITHALVLLTANMDDVKKLARNFVSESLAEKIAEFIVKATQQMTNAMSEDKELNTEASHQVSEENSMYNIGRQGSESGAQDHLKSKEEINNHKQGGENMHSNSESIENNKAEMEVQKPEEGTEKPGNTDSVRLENPSRFSVEPYTIKQYAYPLQIPDKKISKINEEDEIYNKDIKESIKYLNENIESTTEQNKAENQKTGLPVKKKIKGRPYRLLSHGDSIEHNEVLEPKDINKTLDELLTENNVFENKNLVLTTKKAVYEFDQYYNKNYPNSQLVATSGPVVLRKLNSNVQNKWWEKELPGDGSKKKTWY